MDAIHSRLRIGRRFSGPPGPPTLEDQDEHPTPWRGAHAHGNPLQHHPAHRPTRRRARLRRLRPARGLGVGATLLLTEAASRTRRIKLVSGILSIWSRTPGTLAMTAATLHRLSGGRFVLGLGPSTRALVEGFHDVCFAHPADKLREVTTKVRALLAGERALLDATPGARPLRLGQPPAPNLPIWLAAMGDRTVLVAAELADGWFPVFVARDQVADRVLTLRKDREAAGLRNDPLTVVAGPVTVATDDPAAARRITASCIAWYLSAMGDVYARFVTAQGYGGAVQAILEANPRPRPDDGVVPAEAQIVLDQFTAHGTPSQIRDQLTEWDGAVDLAMIGLPPALPWATIEATLRAAAPRA